MSDFSKRKFKRSFLRGLVRCPLRGTWKIATFCAALLSLATLPTLLSQDAGASLESNATPTEVDPSAPINLGVDEGVPKALLVMDLDPSDYLDKVSQNTKTRWRQHYREAPPSAPPADRSRVAFLLGGLMADTYLAHQAKDIQHFKNVNQDLLKHASALALGDRMEAIILVESRMAESEDWIALRAKLFQTQELVDQWLHEQRDEDLAVLVTLGIWLRLFQVTTNIAVEDAAMTEKSLAIGSVAQLNALYVLFDQSGGRKKEDDSTMSSVGKLLNYLKNIWTPSNGIPVQERLAAGKDRIDNLWNKVSQVK